MLNNFTAAVEALPSLPAGRRAALDALRALGLPTTDDEDWKYTDLSALGALSAAEIAPNPANHEFPPDFDCGLDALNVALAGGREVEELRGRAEFDTGLHRRLRLKITGEADLLLEDRTASRFATFFAAIDVAPNARLRLVRVQNADASAQRLTRLKIALGRDARLEAVTVDLGGQLMRHDFDVSLDAAGASAELRGLYLVDGSAHTDNHTRIEHRAPHCASREFFHGIAAGKARAVFNGKIVVHPGAQKTDSEQRVANLLLSKTAEVNAKPELEIYADDVKCAHGATFGQLDENAIFYLRSRGIERDAARTLLTAAFAHQILQHLPDEALRQRITHQCLQKLGTGTNSFRP